MSTALIIRHVTPQDYAQWLPLWDGYNTFYGRSGPTALASEITQITWTCFFDTYEPVYALVAELDGLLVGLAHYLFHRSTIHINSVCYLQDLFTRESARGKGIGKALINGVTTKPDSPAVAGSIGKLRKRIKPPAASTTN